MVTYDVAQICENGHVVNDRTQRNPQSNQKYCDDCGKRTITQCPKCSEPIRGHAYYEHGSLANTIPSPNCCIECGNPYPWFETKLLAARELVDMFEELDDADKELLKTSFSDIAHENPKTEVAALKIKKLAAKLKHNGKDMLYKFAVDVASETAKKILLAGLKE
jgi:hypothetical protein